MHAAITTIRPELTNIETQPTKPEVEPTFREKLASAYNTFLEATKEQPFVPIWRPGDYGIETFGAKNIDYYVSLLSVIGLRPEEGKATLTTEEVSGFYDAYKAELLATPERFNIASRAYEIVNNFAEQHNLQGIGDLNGYHFFFVPEDRIRELNPAAIAFIKDDYVLYPLEMRITSQNSKDQHTQSIVHELLHDFRSKNGLMTPRMYDDLEEGMVQVEAARISPSESESGPYMSQAWVVAELERVLSVSNLSLLTRPRLASRVASQFPQALSRGGTPYSELRADVEDYCHVYTAYDKYRATTVLRGPTAVAYKTMASEVKRMTRELCEKYGFEYPTNEYYFMDEYLEAKGGSLE